MAFVQTPRGLEITRPNWSPGPVRRSVRLYDQFNYDYATIYRTQPNVRTCVDFLARNIAQLGLHVFRRVGETDRVRLREHGLPMLLGRPLPATYKLTRYRLIESLMSDLGIYFNAYWLKLRVDGGLGLLRIPPPDVEPKGGLLATVYTVTVGGVQRDFGPDEVVHFKGYNPENPLLGLPPLETLRRTLAEEHEAGNYRQYFWRNSARMAGIIKRPVGAPDWSNPARERFIAEFEELYSGEENSGKTAVLEEGMEWQQTSFSARESEYLAGRKLTREECARAYHIPLPLVGILDHATFSNIEEQHKHLYQDSLGPWLKMLEQDIDLQLLPEFEDIEGVYSEFNIAEKLAGSFEEQTKSFQAAVGRPWMTANEARARMNMPSMDGDAEQLVTPLNVLVGGQASALDSAPSASGKWLVGSGGKDSSGDLGMVSAGLTMGRKGFDSYAPGMRGRHVEQWTAVLTRHYRRQEAAIVSRVPKGRGGGGDLTNLHDLSNRKAELGGVWWDGERWNSELGKDLLGLNSMTAVSFAERLAEQIGQADFSEDVMMPWLVEHSRIMAEGINGETQAAIEKALLEPEPGEAVRNVFVTAVSAWALRQAVSGVTAAANFGSNEAARAAGLRSKTWRVNSGNPRPEHAAMDGETVGIRENFSNGMLWPGDPAGGADNNSGCQCSVEFG